MEPRRYAIRTFGCQMNEHDSERIAGLPEQDGLVPAGSIDDADVVAVGIHRGQVGADPYPVPCRVQRMR